MYGRVYAQVWYGRAMAESQRDDKKWTAQATQKLLGVLNRADEIGGELRDYLQDKMTTDPRYVSARKTVARLLGRSYESKEDVHRKAQAKAEHTAAVAAVTSVKATRSLGDPTIKAQIYGKRSCPWTGRAITLLERHKVDFDFIDLDEPEHEAKAPLLAVETKQNTVPYVYLRGRFVGGFNALSEIERLGQLEVALMSKEELASARGKVVVEIVPRPNTDEVAPAELEPDAAE
jgi:glutaredoxin